MSPVKNERSPELSDDLFLLFFVSVDGFEPSALCLKGRCSTPELHARCQNRQFFRPTWSNWMGGKIKKRERTNKSESGSGGAERNHHREKKSPWDFLPGALTLPIAMPALL